MCEEYTLKEILGKLETVILLFMHDLYVPYAKIKVTVQQMLTFTRTFSFEKIFALHSRKKRSVHVVHEYFEESLRQKVTKNGRSRKNAG